MKINLIAVGTRMPSWINDGVNNYTQRMPADYQVKLIEIPAVKRDKHTDINAALTKESTALLAKCDTAAITIALDRLGKAITTTELAAQLHEWHDQSQDINILIGGPEGIHADYLAQTPRQWSLSKLTLPHPLVRVVLAEQLYRAYSIIIGHPYHR